MFAINAEVRREQGKGASRRPRATNKSSVIIYGGEEILLATELDHDRVTDIQVKVEFYSEVLTIAVDGKKIKVKTQDVQRHPYEPKLQHIDFVHV